MPKTTNTLLCRDLGSQPYHAVWQAMRDFTDKRDRHSFDEVWRVEHEPIFTQGQAGKPEHVLTPGNIPIVKTDRGGQVTYHGPGQLVVYLLIDLKRRKLGIRQLVRHIEASVIQCLAWHGIHAQARCDAPGVYVDGAKICSLGLRVRRGCCYHGLALNHDMDLQPFTRINPCGFKQLPITQVIDQHVQLTRDQLSTQLLNSLRQILGYNTLAHAECHLPTQQDHAHGQHHHRPEQQTT